MKTKVVALDVYGTFVCSYDHDNELPVRKGFNSLMTYFRDNKIIVVTTSDANLEVLKCDMHDYHIPIEQFAEMFKMERGVQKDYSQIIEKYGIKPEELLVIGDNAYIDIPLAERAGCQTILIPAYNSWGDTFNMLSFINRIL